MEAPSAKAWKQSPVRGGYGGKRLKLMILNTAACRKFLLCFSGERIGLGLYSTNLNANGMVTALFILLGIIVLLLSWWTVSRLLMAAHERKIMLEYLEKNVELDLLNKRLRKDHEVTYSAIGRRLHDDIGAELSSAKLMLASLARSMEGDDFGLYLSIKSSLERAIAQARTISHDLYPACLPTAGLDAALQELCARMHDPRWSAVEYHSSGQARRLDLSHEEVLYRSVRELLINSRKHAAAWKINVRSHWLDRELTIDVLDDGLGLQSVLGDDRGAGHKIIKGTLRMIQADFQIIPTRKGFHASIIYHDN